MALSNPGGNTSGITVAAQGVSPTAIAQTWTVGQSSPDGVWQVGEDVAPPAGSVAATGSYRSVQLRLETIEPLLQSARRVSRDSPDAPTLYLPLSRGRFDLFRIEDSPVMDPALDTAHPEIMTFTAQSLVDPGTSGRISLTPLGFHALIITSTGEAHVIEKISGSTSDDYVVYSERDQPAPGTSSCTAPLPSEQPAVRSGLLGGTVGIASLSSGATLNTYRIAIGATGEFTQRFGGGTVGGGLAAITAGINAANVVLEKEAAIHLVLVANETSIIYTDGATDGYTHLNLATMADENHNKLTTIIGEANYDIGHVFDGDAGLAAQGYAFFGVCVNGWKDRAGTIYYGVPPSNPVGLRTMLHEFGHQFNAYHSFNGTTAACGGSRNPEGAYEPGSGSSIMSYAGLCGAESLPETSLYHTGSLEQMINYTTSGFGGTCTAPSATGNHPPMVSAGSDYSIPVGTPFMLTAVGSDIDGDPVTYSWEQYDLGNPAPPNTDDGTRPLFRIYNPSSSPSRMFPELSFILSSTTAVGQALPSTNRTLTLRVTARDNRAGGGGVATDDTVLTVHASSGPFVVTSPNTAVTWVGGSTETVTWNPAGTDAAPVSAANVKITLSTDNGQSFPIVLAASTANDGVENVTVPNLNTSNARVKVEAVGNIFFDISNAKFTITAAGGQPNLLVTKLATVPAGGYVQAGGTATIKTTIANQGTGASSASKTKFYLSTNKTLSGDDTLLDPPTGQDIPVLAAGAASVNETNVTIPAVGVGAYYLIAFADADNTNVESNETDNTKAIPVYVGPDLIASKVTLSPTTAGGGQPVTVTFETTNKGKQNAGASVARLYYSADKKLKTSVDTLLASVNVGALNAGQKSTNVKSVTVPAGAASGTRYIFALVDAGGDVTEAREVNNSKSAKLTVP